MNNILSIIEKIKTQERLKRKSLKISQQELALRSGVSLGSVKRFENTGQISLSALLKIAFVLGNETDFLQLFVRKQYNSLEEVINETK